MSDKEGAKKRVEQAILKYHEKKYKELLGPQRTNQKPERETEKACLEWMRSHGWDVQIFESKATWNPKINKWMNQSMSAGISDCNGSTDQGLSVAIEFKAKGSRTRLRDNQREYLIKKINSNCFAIVTDSVEYLSSRYLKWLELRALDLQRAKNYLISELP